MAKNNAATVLQILNKSERPMPAHFCGNSFMIDLDGLSESDEYEMASVAWNDTEGIKMDLEKEDAMKVIKLGEDVMLGSFILSKTVRNEDLPDEVAHLEQLLRKRFRSSFSDEMYAQNILNNSESYLEHCISYGLNRAIN